MARGGRLPGRAAGSHRGRGGAEIYVPSGAYGQAPEIPFTSLLAAGGRFFFMPRPWIWGLILGVLVGGGVVLVSSIRVGFSAPLLMLGLVLLVVFGALGLVGSVVSQRRHLDGSPHGGACRHHAEELESTT